MVMVMVMLGCGNYGEDSLSWKREGEGAIVLVRINREGPAQQWALEPTDTLRVSSEIFNAGMETRLVLERGKAVIEIASFEVRLSDGGTSDVQVAALAREVAAAAG